MGNSPFAKSYRVCVVDVDGTLVDEKHQIPSGNVEAIKKLRKRGIPLVIMTARSLFDLRKIIEVLGLEDDIAITEGGGRIRFLGEGQPILEEVYLTSEIIEQLFNIGKSMEVSPVVYIGDETFTENLDNPYLSIFEAAMNTTVRLSVDLRAQIRDQKIVKILYLNDPGKIVEIEKRITCEANGNVYTSRSLPFALDVAATTKKKALDYVLNKLKIDLTDCVVIGDSPADVEAIKYAGLGVAMGNAPAEVKEIADYITASNNEGGVAEVIQKAFLKEED